ncbi:hypothetical protein BJ508DRAFT_419709 [Ascobolus immersus RN42]|uniref:Uncharacterized protein n=1 Tax=Ascobolus immersus RN42 TaxID=1160509 RepID=A0A3N4HIA0_ASCIM|nr:hypothetical protein BJ508DRAFT_419709 [Ascobolus immersus RN42]
MPVLSAAEEAFRSAQQIPSNSSEGEIPRYYFDSEHGVLRLDYDESLPDAAHAIQRFDKIPVIGIDEDIKTELTTVHKILELTPYHELIPYLQKLVECHFYIDFGKLFHAICRSSTEASGTGTAASRPYSDIMVPSESLVRLLDWRRSIEAERKRLSFGHIDLESPEFRRLREIGDPLVRSRQAGDSFVTAKLGNECVEILKALRSHGARNVLATDEFLSFAQKVLPTRHLSGTTDMRMQKRITSRIFANLASYDNNAFCSGKSHPVLEPLTGTAKLLFCVLFHTLAALRVQETCGVFLEQFCPVHVFYLPRYDAIEDVIDLLYRTCDVAGSEEGSLVCFEDEGEFEERLEKGLVRPKLLLIIKRLIEGYFIKHLKAILSYAIDRTNGKEGLEAYRGDYHEFGYDVKEATGRPVRCCSW